MTFMSGWQSRIPITIDPATISGGLSGDLTDFPVLITLSSGSGINNKDLTPVFKNLNSYVDDFTGTDGDAPRSDYWSVAGNADSWSVQINNNKVRCSWTESTGSTYRTAYIHTAYSIMQLEEDFTAYIHFNRVSTTFDAGNIRAYVYFPYSSSNNYAYIYAWWDATTRGFSAKIYEDGVKVDDHNQPYASWSDVNDSYFRIRRSGMTVYLDFDDVDGPLDGWQNLASFTSKRFQGRAYFRFVNYSSGVWNGTQVVDWDDFVCTPSGIYDTTRRSFAVTTDDGTTECFCEIDSWDMFGNSANIHAKIPIISNTADTQLYLYYTNYKAANMYYVGQDYDRLSFSCLGTDRQGAYDGASLVGPWVIKDDSLYKMWYAGRDFVDSIWRIMYAESRDLYMWSNHQLAINIESEGTYDTNGIIYPCVIKDGSTYKMWYSGYNGSNWRVLYASSSDGLNWANHQMVKDVGDYTPFDDNHAYTPSVIKDGSTYKMWYGGNGTTPHNYWKIIYATSADGINWANHQVVIDKNQEGVYDTSHALLPCVLKENSSYRIWYSGHEGANWRTMFAEGSDGINWANHQMIIDLGTEGYWDTTHAYAPAAIADDKTTVSGAYHVFYSGYPGASQGVYRTLHARSYGAEDNFVTVSGFMETTGSGTDWDKTITQSENDNLLYYGDAEYDVGVIQRAVPLHEEEDEITIYGEVPEEKHGGYITVYNGASDGGMVPSNWDAYEALGLQGPGDTFDTTVTGLSKFATRYYKWYATYSGSDASEYWSPSYSFQLYMSKILKGVSNDFRAVCGELESTFVNTGFTAISYDAGAALTTVRSDVVVGCTYSTTDKDAVTDDTRIKVIVDSSKVNDNLTNFPLFVRLSASSGINDQDLTAIFDTLGSNSKKLKVKTAAGAECYVEIERWANTSSQAELWVRAPSISSVEDTVFYIEYNSGWADNVAYVGDIGSAVAQNVWDAGCSFIYHMNQDPTPGAGSILDSTGNYDADPQGSMNAADLVDGRLGIGKALNFDGNDDWINGGNDTMAGINNVTLSCWVTLSNFNHTDYCWFIANNGTTKLCVGFDHAVDQWKAGHWSPYHWLFGSSYSTYNTWNHIVAVTRGYYFYIYRNGSIMNSESCHSLPNANQWRIAHRHDGTDTHPGKIDEVRIEKTGRSDEWIVASYYGESDNLVNYFTDFMRGPLEENTSDVISVR